MHHSRTDINSPTDFIYASVSKPLLIIVILGALSTISPFAIDMYLPAFKEISIALHTSTARVSLSLASYFAGLAAGQLFYGPLLDRFGRKLPLYAGLILFIVASLLCLLSRTVEWLIALRFLQALGGCAAQVASMPCAGFLPCKRHCQIISLLILILSASPLLAPSVVFLWRCISAGSGCSSSCPRSWP
ncbi:MAG: MFS transporter [Limisphaerales bacterium]